MSSKTLTFNRRWKGQREGNVVEWPSGSADYLIRRGIASEYKPPKRKRGRQIEFPEHKFISDIGKRYIQHFGKKPATSKGTRFVRFLREVFRIVAPQNAFLQGDISYLATSATKGLGPTT